MKKTGCRGGGCEFEEGTAALGGEKEEASPVTGKRVEKGKGKSREKGGGCV